MLIKRSSFMQTSSWFGKLSYYRSCFMIHYSVLFFFFKFIVYLTITTNSKSFTQFFGVFSEKYDASFILHFVQFTVVQTMTYHHFEKSIGFTRHPYFILIISLNSSKYIFLFFSSLKKTLDSVWMIIQTNPFILR